MMKKKTYSTYSSYSQLFSWHKFLTIIHMEALPNLDDAKIAESKGDIDKAIILYEKAIRTGCADENCFKRLMILYRKQRRYKEELAVIKKGIALFAKKLVKKTPASARLKKLSKAFGQKTGLLDKKGQQLFMPEPLISWQKRALLVQKKISGNK